MVEYAPHEQRVIEEQKDLAEKIVKLNNFLESPTHRSTILSMNALDVSLLRQQYHAMMVYGAILRQRIGRFKTE